MMGTILPFARTAPAEPMASDPTQAQASGPRGDPAGADESWEALMLRAQDGDRAAYHALLRQVTPYLRSIARRYLGHGEDAEDALQEILLVLHGIRHTYERGRPFKPWLSTIANRRCIDLLRRRTRRLRHEVAATEGFEEHPGSDQGPVDATSRRQGERTLDAAVERLPERQREAVRLLRLNELSLREAAAQSEQSVGALKVACHRALKSLKRALAPRSRAPQDRHHD